MKKIIVIIFSLLLAQLFIYLPNIEVANANQNTEINQSGNEVRIDIINEIEESKTENIQPSINNAKGERGDPKKETLPSQRVRARNREELKSMIRQKVTEMNQEVSNYSVQEQKVYRNQNAVRLIVHTLLAMEDLVGGIGPQVSEIAREFDNSVQKNIQTEEKIQNRNKLVRFLVGGDQSAAEEIEREVNKNKLTIQRLKNLRNICQCDEEVKDIFQEQIQNMEKEQSRLERIAKQEKSNRGIFGWLIDLFR